jgi:hypothetical protein
METKPIGTRRLFVASLVSSIACLRATKVPAQEPGSSSKRRRDVPESAQAIEAISGDGFEAFCRDHTVWLHLTAAALEGKRITIPRLFAPMRSFGWKDHHDAELKFAPEPREWNFTWKNAPADVRVIEIVFDAEPVLLSDLPAVRSAADGSLMLHAYQASTHGEKLRFEPQPFKNTVGYWAVPTDYATWNLANDEPGT